MPRRTNSSSPTPGSSIIPAFLEKEIYYYFVFLRKAVEFDSFAKACPDQLFGKPASDLRIRVTRFVDKIRQSLDYHLASTPALINITAADAPHAHNFFLANQHLFAGKQPTQHTPTPTMSSHSDNKSSASGYDSDPDFVYGDRKAPVQSPPTPTTPSDYYNNGGGKMVVASNDVLDARLLARTNFSNGIPLGIHLPTFHYLLQRLNNVYALDHAKPETLPRGVDFILIKHAPNLARDVSYDKFILILQVSDMDTLASISAKLSPDGKVIIVEIPAKEM